MASPRTELAAILRANKPSKTQVYDHPTDVAKVPCFIVQNADPMVELDTMGGKRFQWNLEIVAATTRANPKTGVTWCEDAARAVFGYLQGTGYWFQTCSQPETIEINGVDAIAVTMTVQAKMQT